MSDTQGHVGGSIERTLAGDAELEILPVLREAWARTEGIKAIMVGGLLPAVGRRWGMRSISEPLMM